MLKCIEKVGRRRANLQKKKKKNMTFGRDSPGKSHRGMDFDGQTPRLPWAGRSPLGCSSSGTPGRGWARPFAHVPVGVII